MTPTVLALSTAVVWTGALLLARSTGRWAPYIWLSVLASGRAITLAAVDAGKGVGYQHLTHPLAEAWPSLVWLGIGLWVAVVMAGVVRDRAALAERARALSGVGWVVVGAFSFMVAATVSREIGFYAGELAFAGILQLVHLANLGLVLVHLDSTSVPSRLSAVLEPGPAEPRLADGFALRMGLLTTLLCVVLALWVYERHPHVPDELGYLYHARYFALGWLTMPAPPVPEAFLVDLMTFEPDVWYSPVPPGWPAMLAVGARFGVPWLVNPVLAGVNVVLAHLLVWRLTDRPTARLSAILLALSPWALFLGMSFMTHTWAFTCLLVAALSVERLRATGGLGWGVLGGVAIGWISLIRPLEGLAVALLLGLWSLAARGRGFRWMPSLVLTLSTLPAGVLQLAYNARMTGHARTFPLMQYFDDLYGPGSNDLGFGPDKGVGWALDPYPGHGLRDVIVNGNLNLTATNVELFGWGMGSLLFLWVALGTRRWSKLDSWLVALIAMILGTNALYYFSGGPDFGARYWYPILLPCVLLSVRGIRSLAERLPRLPEAVVLATVASVVVFVPWRSVDKYRDYRGMRPDVRVEAGERDWGEVLVVVRGARDPDYHSAAIYNPLPLDSGEPVYVWDRGPDVVERVLAAWPGRPVWIVDGPSETGEGFEVRAGPLQPERARSCVAEGRWPECS